MNLSLESRIARSDNQLATEVDGEIVILGVDEGKYYNLDFVGGTIWKLIEQPIRVGDLCAALESRFAVSAQDCRRDTLDFLAELADRRLIVSPAD